MSRFRVEFTEIVRRVGFVDAATLAEVREQWDHHDDALTAQLRFAPLVDTQRGRLLDVRRVHDVPREVER